MSIPLLVLAFCLPAGLALECAVRAGAVAQTGPFLMVRVAAHLSLLTASFGLAWRPLLAGFCYLGVVGGLTVASRIKHRIMRENVVFSDLLLVRTIIRHPRLYYLGASDYRIYLGGAVLAAFLTGWLLLEESLLPAAPAALVAAPLPLLAGLLGLWGTARLGGTPVARAALPSEDPTAAIDAAIGAVGLLASLLTLWGEWARMPRPPAAAIAQARQSPGVPAQSAAAGPLIVAIQCESFLNPKGRGLATRPLPGFERASAGAIHAGRLEVPAFAANTMRSEFAFLSGLPNVSLGCDRFNPYLAASAYADLSWPERMRRAGWRTVFIHPYDRRFFERDRVVPALGFERAVWQDDFHGCGRRGPYIADREVGGRILREAHASAGPTFIFAVTMENHGPWGPGRIPGVDDPLEQYLHHLQGADEMIAVLMEGLKDRPGRSVLCLYGDHVPALRGLGPEAEAGLTDFAVVDPSGQTEPARRPGVRRVEELLALCVASVRGAA